MLATVSLGALHYHKTGSITILNCFKKRANQSVRILSCDSVGGCSRQILKTEERLGANVERKNCCPIICTFARLSGLPKGS